MTQKRKTDQTELIAAAAMALAAKRGWAGLSLKDIAKKARLPVKKVEARFKDAWAILAWVLKKLDADITAHGSKIRGGHWRDNLFDIIMARFDLMQKCRGAFTVLPQDFAQTPKKISKFIRPFYKSLATMLELSGIKKQSCTPVFATALAVIYLSVVHVWSLDETRDLSKTMAALDQRLEWLERLVEFKEAA